MDLYHLGRCRMEEAMRGGEELHVVLTKLLATKSASGGRMAAGALGFLLEVYGAARSAGYKPAVEDRSITALLNGPHATLVAELLHEMTSGKRGAKHPQILSAICGTVQAVRARVRFVQPATKSTETAPVRVEIVSLPPTMAIQTVERDEDDDIKRTVTITTSAPAA